MKYKMDTKDRDQQARFEKMMDRALPDKDWDQAWNLLYMWVKQAVISQREFRELSYSLMSLIVFETNKEIIEEVRSNVTQSKGDPKISHA